jgi:hypothetical protein
MVLNNKQKLVIGGAILGFIVLVVLVVLMTGHKKTAAATGLITPVVAPVAPVIPPPTTPPLPQLKPIAPPPPPVKTSPILIPVGTLPANGEKFVVKSTTLGSYMSDNGDLVSDIKNAKVFTYDTTADMTNEQVTPPARSGSTNSQNMTINFANNLALIGSSSGTQNGNVAYGVLFDDKGWTFGSVQYNPAAALSPQYAYAYSAQFYYI